MGAFLLVSEQPAKFETARALETMSLQGNTKPVLFKLPGWNLWLSKKSCVEEPNFRDSEDCSLFATGTPFIPGKGYSGSLDILLDQLRTNNLNTENIRGQFFLLLRSGTDLTFITDHYGNYSIYHTSDGNVISSSFLSICSGLNDLSVDRDSLTENMLTGSLIGENTVFNEIKRFEPSLPFQFTGIKHIKLPDDQPVILKYRNRKKSQLKQIEILDDYFSRLKPLAEEQGIDSGITGGFDSRLILALCRRHFSNDKIQFHAHLRKTPDRDFLTGKEICQKSDLKFIETPVTDISDIRGDEIINVMDRGMLFNDGQVRTHSFWHEEFNTASYRINTLRDMRTGLNGIGGEQYRNTERILFSGGDLRRWIDVALIQKYSGRTAADKKCRADVTERILSKINSRLGSDNSSKVSLGLVKRYMNEIYNPSNRGLRTGFENRLSYFISPFADRVVAEEAYNIIGLLGLSFDYEAEMIRMIDPQLALVNSVYGFSFTKGESLKSYFPEVVFRNFLPFRLQASLQEKLIPGKTGRWNTIFKHHDHLCKCLNRLESFELPVNLHELLLKTDIGPLVFAMGHLLLAFSDKIKKYG